MAPVRVDTDTYTAASKIFGADIADAIFGYYRTLQDALYATAQMSGSDPAGVSWGTSYDEAVERVNGVTQDVINGCYQLAALLEQSGFNHGVANSASVPGGTVDVTDTSDYADYSVLLGGFPSGSGATGSDTPSGWWLVEHTVGYVWPNGHQDKLRAAAAAWSRAAQSLTAIAWVVPSAVSQISSLHSPEVGNAVTACNAMKTHIDDLSAAYNCVSTACNDYAGYIDNAHSEAIDELESLVAWTIGIEAAGAVAGFFTLGIGEGVAQGVEAGRIAATALRIANIIAHLIEMVGEVVATIGRAVSKVIEVSAKLTALLGARLSKITADLVARLAPKVAEDAEGLAVEGLDFATEADTAIFWSGNTAGVSAEDAAASYASRAGGTTLEQLEKERGINLPEYDRAKPETVQAWRDASQAYAEGASGKVRAVVGDTVRPDSVWKTIELPALQNNPFVTEIVEVNAVTGEEVVIWTR